MADRCVAVDDIVGLAEIAKRTSNSTQTVWNWTHKDGFPEAITKVSGRPVWDWKEVDSWNRSWVRSKGGFPTHRSRTPA